MSTVTGIPVHGEDKHEPNPALQKIHDLFHALLEHDGFGEIRVEMRILKRGQKEVIIHCGKQYRFVLDVPQGGAESAQKTRKGGLP